MTIVFVNGKAQTVEERIAEIDAMATGSRKTALESLKGPKNELQDFGRRSIWARITDLLPPSSAKSLEEPTIMDEAFPNISRFIRSP